MKHLILSALLVTAPLAAQANGNHGPGDQCNQPSSDPVGLSLFFRNGAMPALELVGDSPRYIQELDILEESTSTVDEGIDPIIDNGGLSDLDWRGVEMVEETWVVGFDGSFTRQRFYRNAKWMERESLFILFATDASGDVVSAPILAYAGKDDKWKNADDNFIRRFDARQIATGCPAIGDCTGATFTAQGLVQLRGALHPNQRAEEIPAEATQLSLFWTEDFSNLRSVYTNHHDASEFDFGYGLEVSLEEASTPTNGQFYLPGDTVSFKVTFRDHDGNRLHPDGSLPTFGQFLRGEIESGLRYFDFSIPATLYYSLKHRESNEAASLAGPIDKLKVSTRSTGIFDFFGPQLVTASVATDGYSGLVVPIPSGTVLLLTGTIPGIEDTPISDVVSFTIPTDALPGTYVAAIKMRREWGGEALNRSESAEIQVGSATISTYTPKTGNCNSCHNNNSSLGEILHGQGDRRTCFSCHNGLDFEPDNFLDIRVHTIHDRSDRFDKKMSKCSTCHLSTPPGPARGILGLPE